MDTIEKILAHAETQIRELAARAISRGDYSAGTEAVETARRLATLRPPAPEKERVVGRPASTQKSSAPYPRFLRDGDVLVKVAWSKKDSAEYEHRAPKKTVDTVLGLLSSQPRLFTVEDLTKSDSDGALARIPGYQTYLVLAWLRGAGLLSQHGRRGYTVPNRKNFADRAADLWNQLGK